MGGIAPLDLRGLERDLARVVDGEVRFDAGSRALYATDASNFRQPPIGVVIPRTLDDVVATHQVCARHGAPILSRGGGTSLSGETVNHAVVLDHKKYLHAILDVDPDQRRVTVQSGAVNQQVNERVAAHGLVFPPDPSTHEYCTIGGNVGNNSCGVHSVQAEFYGEGARTSDNVESLEILTYDGERLTVGPTGDDELARIVEAGGRRGQIYRDLRDLRDRYADLIRARFPRIPRRVSGYNLDDLLPENGFDLAAALCGTEGTCATVLTATLKLTPQAPARSLLVLGFSDIATAADHVPAILEHRPIALEGIDQQLYTSELHFGLHRGALSQMPDGDAWLLVELPGETREESDARAVALIQSLEREGALLAGHRVFDSREEERALWQVREAGLAATAFSPEGEDFWPGWEDAAVPPARVGDYLRDLRALYDRYGFRGALYGHFGQGCIHSRINFDLRSADGVARYRAFIEDAADLVVSYGGSLSGEHGDGQQRAELLEKMYGPELIQAFREFKAIWDPEWKMNPGKVVDADRLDANLRLGPDYNPWRPPVRFAYQEDQGDFAHAALRCVGVGKCIKPGGVDVMCPSYMVLREEKHTTRGRARLLHEMLQGDLITEGWRSPEVKEALDLCLSCKGCTNDCPVNVDMPTYKAEFLHHHWKGRLRPRHAYAFGLIDQAARVAARVPRLVNALARAPGTGAAIRAAAGMTQRRPIPRFASTTLRAWFAAREQRTTGEPVILWPDTFTNYFRPQVGVAAVEALEAAGRRVLMPPMHLCCGRPLYDFGFLGLAERYLRNVIDELRPYVRAGVPVVGVEPSCVATFRDELPKLMPHDEDAGRLARQTRHLAAFFLDEQFDLPPLEGEALVWGHCHQKATGGIEPEHELLARMGVRVEAITGGCCGLAGSWGFEPGHYDISVACAEQALAPRIRAAPTDALIVADGFSCQTQIQHTSPRRALHVAEVMRLARARDRLGGGRPEDDPLVAGA